MKSLINLIMNQKGIKNSQKELDVLASRWQSLQNMKNNISIESPLTIDIALQNIPRSGKNE